MPDIAGALLPDQDITVWPFLPSWPGSAAPPQTEMAYLTEVIMARGGLEQRVALRFWPRTEFQFQLVLWGDRLRQAKNLIWGKQRRPWAVADPSRWFVIDELVPAGTAGNLLTVGAPSWVQPGRVCVVTNGTVWEMVVVQSIDNGVATLAAPTQSDWPAGSRIHYGWVGYLAEQNPIDKSTTNAQTLTATLQVFPGSEVPIPEDHPPGTQFFLNHEVFIHKPNWAEDVTGDFRQTRDVTDFDRGAVNYAFPVPFGSATLQATYLAMDAQALDALRTLFMRMKGRRGEFLTPTWEPDFDLRRGASASSTVLRVRGAEVAELYAGSRTHRLVYVHTRQGELFFGQVSSLAEVFDNLGRDTEIRLVLPLPGAVAAEDVLSCGWLLRTRFSSDTLTIQHLTDAVANVTLNLTVMDAPEYIQPV